MGKDKKIIKRILTILIVCLIGIYLNGFLFKGYRIINFNPVLKHKINQTLNETIIPSNERVDDFNEDSLVIRNKVKIDNMLIIFFTYDLEIEGSIKKGHGIHVYKQGFNLSYKSNFGSYTSGGIEHFPYIRQVIETRSGRYVLIMGLNEEGKNLITYKVNGVQYEDQLPNERYFIIYRRVPDSDDFNDIPVDVNIK